MKAYTIVLSIGMLLLAGCGQKGPLYLPQDRVDQSTIDSSQVDNSTSKPAIPSNAEDKKSEGASDGMSE